MLRGNDMLDHHLQATEQAASNGDTEAAGALPNGDAEAGPSGRKEEEPMFSLDEAAATRAEVVGTSSPVDDFRSLLRQGQLDKAFSGMSGIIMTLIDRSLGDR